MSTLRDRCLLKAAATVLLLAAIAISGPGKKHGRKERSCMERMYGGINPSSMTVIDDDFECSMSEIGWDPARPTGRGVLVAVLDGGFNLDHPEIVANLSPLGYDAIDGDNDPHDTGNGIDDDLDWDLDWELDEGDEGADACTTDSAVGHGTFVAGMVLCAAPDATIVPVRVRDDEGWGTNDQLVRGLEYAIAIGVDVINLSLDSAAARKLDLARVLREARRAGIVVVLAAGNDGERLRDTNVCRQAVVVGATSTSCRVASFSNYSTDPDFGLLMIYADGVDLIGPMGAGGDDTSLGLGSGTSFSAGIVSGAVAAYRERHPAATVEETVEALRRSTDPVWHDRIGSLPGGRLDVERMVRR